MIFIDQELKIGWYEYFSVQLLLTARNFEESQRHSTANRYYCVSVNRTAWAEERNDERIIRPLIG